MYILMKQPTYQEVFNDPTIYQALQLIHRTPSADWTLEALARQIGMSRTAFATRFRTVVGLPPMRYVTHWRLLKARELLDTTNLTVDSVSKQVGYQSEAAFARAFKREFGQSPGQARRDYSNS
jgi:AraC-like DNA-binding protein